MDDVRKEIMDDLEDLDILLDTISEKTDELEKEAESLQKELSESEQMINTLKHKISDVETRIAVLSEKCDPSDKEHMREANELKAELKNLRTTLYAAEQKHKNRMQTIEKTLADIAAQRKFIARNRQSVAADREKYTKAFDALDASAEGDK